jgi:predicted AlkP superfamily pyrophosphatase or phosphodiesterase
MRKILVIQVAALGYDFLKRKNGSAEIGALEFRPIQSIFPAVTCAVQATMRTAEPPGVHGMVGNGFYFRELAKPLFWEQSSSLIRAPRIWEAFRRSGGTVGQMFIQQSLGAESDLLVSPAPIHKHHGGMIQDCYSRPAGLYPELGEKVGRPFKLRHYWGPLASVKSTEWITDAACEVIRSKKTDLLFTYLPHLDYELQRTGPLSEKSARAFSELKALLEKLLNTAREAGYKALVFGDYAITDVNNPMFPNRILREAGLMAVRKIKKMAYPDFHSSRAFAVVDHQVAHVIIKNKTDADAVRNALEGASGIERILGKHDKKEMGIDHPRSGELVLVAEKNAWFAYPWWTEKREAPDYAAHIDIHNKPGYDPCELFFGRLPVSVSTDATKVRGSHGRVGEGLDAAWATDMELGTEPATLLDLAKILKGILM